MSHIARVSTLLPRPVNRCEARGTKKSLISSHRRAGTHAYAALDAVLKAVEARQVFRQLDRFGRYSGDSEVIDTQRQRSLGVTCDRHTRSRHPGEEGADVHDEVTN